MSQPISAESSQAALWSMVLGIASVPVGLCAGTWGLAPFLIGGAAVVLGIVALARIRRSQGLRKGRAHAWLGMLLGAVMCVVGVVIALLTVAGDVLSWVAQIL